MIETLLIKIRSCPEIKGIKSPTSNEELLTSAFADDSVFFIDGVNSAINILFKFEQFGLASGSKVNKDKTEGMWLGKFRNRTYKPIEIQWVKTTKSLGMHFGYKDTENIKWISCIDCIQRDL